MSSLDGTAAISVVDNLVFSAARFPPQQLALLLNLLLNLLLVDLLLLFDLLGSRLLVHFEELFLGHGHARLEISGVLFFGRLLAVVCFAFAEAGGEGDSGRHHLDLLLLLSELLLRLQRLLLLPLHLHQHPLGLRQQVALDLRPLQIVLLRHQGDVIFVC